MWFTDIILVIVGIVAVVISYKISVDSEGTGEKTHEYGGSQLWSEQDEKTIRKRIEKVMEEKVDVVLDQAEYSLSRLSNEKMISMHEMSEQVLEKIDKNHSDVVFMYNMLNEKETDLKKLLNVVDRKVSSVKNEIGGAEGLSVENADIPISKSGISAVRDASVQDVAMRSSAVREPAGHDASVRGPVGSEAAGRSAANMRSMLANKGKTAGKAAPPQAGGSAISRLAKRGVVEPAPKKTAVSRNMSVSDLLQLNASKSHEEEALAAAGALHGEDGNASGGPRDNKDRIVALYKRGKSVLDISKELDMGQGEVQFIIDLYGK